MASQYDALLGRRWQGGEPSFWRAIMLANQLPDGRHDVRARRLPWRNLGYMDQRMAPVDFRERVPHTPLPTRPIQRQQVEEPLPEAFLEALKNM